MRLLILFFLIFSTPVLSQNVSTISVGNPDDDIVLDQQGNLYISQFFSGNIIKYTPDGQGSLFKSGLKSANGLAFDSFNNLYVCDFVDEKIVVLNLEAEIINSFSVSGNPSGILKDKNSDDLIFTNYSENTISRLSPDGNITLINSNNELDGPVGLTQDEEGKLFVNNFNDAKIFEVLPDNELRYIATLPSEGQSPFLGFIAYGKGKLWGTMMETHKIYSIDPCGVDDFSLFAGSVEGNKDGNISVATFNSPNGITFSNDFSKLYISDSGSSNLRVISDLSLSTTKSLSHSIIEVFPNPTDEILNINIPSHIDGEWKLNIFNSFGVKVISGISISSNQDQTLSIDLSYFKSGLYFVLVETKNHIYSTPFIKT